MVDRHSRRRPDHAGEAVAVVYWSDDLPSKQVPVGIPLQRFGTDGGGRLR